MAITATPIQLETVKNDAEAIRTQLKKEFPDTEFSVNVNSDRFGKYAVIEYTDGASQYSIRKAIYKVTKSPYRDTIKLATFRSYSDEATVCMRSRLEKDMYRKNPTTIGDAIGDLMETYGFAEIPQLEKFILDKLKCLDFDLSIDHMDEHIMSVVKAFSYFLDLSTSDS